MAEWIIVVDDDRLDRYTAAHILSKAGFRVTGLEDVYKLKECVHHNGMPNLVIMNVTRHDTDAIDLLKQISCESQQEESLPVMFVSREEEQGLEALSQELGAMDLIRKPYDPDILLTRVRHLLLMRQKIQDYEREASTDQLTGMINQHTASKKMQELCNQEEGFLCILDLDSFKMVNDIYGHDMGDSILVLFSRLLRRNLDFEAEYGRIGGDEFILFAKNVSEGDMYRFSQRLNEDFLHNSRKKLGEGMQIPLGVSVGAVEVPRYGRDYASLFHFADQALRYVKLNGKHSCNLWGKKKIDEVGTDGDLDLETLTSILEERNDSTDAMWMGKEYFASVYQYMVRYMDRYRSIAYRVLFTLTPTKELSEEEHMEIMIHFRKLMQGSLRNSDIMMESGENQLFLLLPEIREYDIERVISRLLMHWRHSEYSKKATINYETGIVRLKRHPETAEGNAVGNHVAVVDEDDVALRMAEFILHRQNMQVTCLHSVEELLEMMKGDNQPDLILLNTVLQNMSGIEALYQLRHELASKMDAPVIFMIEGDNPGLESRCMEIGAMDLVRKPFVQEVLATRVRHALELSRLQRNFTSTVDRRTRENENLALRMVQALVENIDGKDRSTRGHSFRVAEYAREIARRAGYSIMQQDEIYMLGLMHDVGKMMLPDEILNKAGKLTPEEYELVKGHAIQGARMLQRVIEMPRLMGAARWHHERYDGKGYPDGLKEGEIPEEVRILTVADAYDAMSSYRSYRPPLEQSKVREELSRGSGKQFDPAIVGIMFDMMDEDPNYLMSEMGGRQR